MARIGKAPGTLDQVSNARFGAVEKSFLVGETLFPAPLQGALFLGDRFRWPRRDGLTTG